MTKDEFIVDYLYSKTIPKSFILDLKKTFYISITLDDFKHGSSLSLNHKYFLCFGDSGITFALKMSSYNSISGSTVPYISEKCFMSENNESFDYCISDFLYWWEINKHRCTDIEYFKLSVM